MEQLFDLYSGTLASGYTAGSGSASVTSATGLPSIGTYSVTILDPSTFAVKVCLEVTARSGTTLTVTADGTDANASSGDVVLGGILSTRSMRQIQSDWQGYGAYSSLPSTTNRLNGMIFKSSNGPHTWFFNGSIWVPFVDGIATASPSALAWAWRNQNGSTISSAGGVERLLVPGTAATAGIIGRETTAPATPYVITAAIRYSTYITGSTGSGLGLYFADSSSGKLVVFQRVVSQTPAGFFNVQYWTNATTISSTPQQDGASRSAATGLLWMRIANDGTNFTFSTSPDGMNWDQVYQVARTAFLTTPDLVGFFGIGDNGNYYEDMSLQGWLVT